MREPDDHYDAARDFAGSVNVAYEAIRERVARGGPPWVPATPGSRLDNRSGDETTTRTGEIEMTTRETMKEVEEKSATYRTSRPITMAELFDGRLGLHGVFEWDGWQYWGSDIEDAIQMGFDPCERTLTDVVCDDDTCEDYCDAGRFDANYITVNADDESAAVTFSALLSRTWRGAKPARQSCCNPSRIFDAIAKAFDVEVQVIEVKTQRSIWVPACTTSPPEDHESERLDQIAESKRPDRADDAGVYEPD